MSNCIFCKIVNGEIAAQKVFEDKDMVVFHDINPAAEVHVLVVPKKHIESLSTLTDKDNDLIAKLTQNLTKVATMLGLETGFKTLINTGEGGGQLVPHLHYHILGGKLTKLQALKNT
ncbi:histidine triad nucleotide-binding protein [Facilibium subflavum]|uniref:histidine triad nucleotide-binding protein n=1 Tax=Facilibium subflavum TaxID=2219058 RepID=UPI000E64E7B8|nr:histidine triad nucleotide-binding protein [Facilibium subflavum]